ncbi:hypothetical protein MM213_09855 [Belliella sp. R4-6]|uniref:Uncharacterized protein n=1 Tax=Belliella alkalica TaxID=1730871 RepID=A0ABS9VBP4_9BACT|nr:hypothetical protein [Belliella alkalica]MCH7413788.1 hypothetical protein [Belliella alkalica]
MKLHQNKELFINSMRVTGQQMKIPAIYVEKDYWLTYFKKLVYGEFPKENEVFETLNMIQKRLQHITWNIAE